MIDKLKFIPTTSHVILEYINKKSKLTPKNKINDALRILSGCSTDDLQKFFIPVFNAMAEEKYNEEERMKELKKDKINTDPESPEVA